MEENAALFGDTKEQINSRRQNNEYARWIIGLLVVFTSGMGS
jgi:hypothetical protein